MFVSKIKPEDFPVLTQLLGLPEAFIIYDPLRKIKHSNLSIATDIATLLKSARFYPTCINLSNQQLEVLSFDFILEVGKTVRTYPTFSSESFLAINNPNGTIRWFLPQQSSYPDFLALYNNSGMKAKLFKATTRIAYKLGFKNWIFQNNFVLYAKEKDFFQNQYGQQAVSIFTGTVGKNRKAVAALCQSNRATHFIKIPISERARRLILDEHEHLKALAQYDFKRLSMPTAEMTALGLKLSNVQPKTYQSPAVLNNIHLSALKDLYASTFQLKPIKQLNVYGEVFDYLTEIKHSLEKRQTGSIDYKKAERLAYNLRALMRSIGQQPVPIGYAHGDFTPWNMFQSSDHLHVYDWELAQPEQVFLYDAFHFIFQSGALLLRQSFQQIHSNIFVLQRHPVVIDLIERYALEFRTCYHWYLIHNCSYYLNIYMKQEPLHQQAHWLIDLWINATNSAILYETKKEVRFATA